jgi:4-hydroxybenzoate polyprenyltransferase
MPILANSLVNSQTSPRIKAEHFASLIRPQMSVLPLLVYTSVLAINEELNITNFLVGWLVLLSSYAVVVIYNDIVDIRIDKANNRKDTPLAVGVLSKKEAYYALLTSLIIGLVASTLLSPLTTLWFIAYIALGWLYSGYFTLKDKGYFALTILAICYGAMPWLLGIFTSNAEFYLDIIVIIFASFMYVFGIISLKDFKDYKGDKKYGKNTVLVAKGPIFTKNLILSITSAAYLTFVLLTFLQNLWLLASVGVVCSIVNFVLLSDPKVIFIANVRSRNGKVARLIFFIFGIIVYAII